DRDLEVLVLRLESRGADRAGAQALADHATKLLEGLDKAKREDRPRTGRVLLARAAARRAAGDAGTGELVEARVLLGDDDPEVLAERHARARAAHDPDAVATARALRDLAPADFAAAQRVLDTYLELGWTESAANELRTWRDKFPRRTAELVQA